MADFDQPAARIVVVGANHSRCSLLLRDRLFVDDGQVPAFLGRLAAAGVDECLVLSTCDRVEVQAAHAEPTVLTAIVQQALAAHGQVAATHLDGALYTHVGRDAVRHIFAVAASLDSQVIGEPQVLGQVKAAHRLARLAGTIGPALEPVLQAAYGTAKRVRSETAIAEGPVTIASSAVQVARDVHGALDRCAALLIGGGEMGELIVARLRDAGLSRLTVAAASASRAAAEARRLQCRGATFDELASAVAAADIVVSAAGLGRLLVSAELVAGALKRRRFRPIFVIDAAVPGDVEPAVDRLEEAFLYDLDDLEGVAQEGRANRARSTALAWHIVDDELAVFLRARAERTAVPALQSLQRHFAAAREEALARAPDDAAEATRLLVNRLLHDPSEVLREAAGDETLAAALRRLYRLAAGGDEEESTQ
jgi:glutamyl-tRNA reductase